MSFKDEHKGTIPAETDASRDLSEIARADFEARVGADLTVFDLDGSTVPAKFAGVRSGPVIPGAEQFALDFLVSRPLSQSQSIFRVSDAELGNLDIFLVMVGMTEAGAQYEAAFSRFTDRSRFQKNGSTK